MSKRRPPPSPRRDRPQPCRHFASGRCTGCTRLHVPYEQQLSGKETWVRETLAPVLAGATFGGIAPSPRQMGYRTSVKLCLHEDREGRRAIGLYRQGTREVAHVLDCPAADAGLMRTVASLFRRGLRLPARLYDHRGRVFQKGRLKFLIGRCAPGGGMGLIVVHTGVPRDHLEAWLARAQLGDVSVYESRLTVADRSELLGRRVDHLFGPETFSFPLGGTSFALSPESFFQANHSLSDALVRAATAFRGDGDVLLDLYGGFGAYSFAVAGRFQAIHVVDGNGAAAQAGNRAAAKRGLDHIRAHAATCERFLAELAPEVRGRVTHVLVNPPRSGLSSAVVRAIAGLSALRELIYVSCHPETLVRDLALLVRAGPTSPLAIRAARPFDMFPHTEHVETVVHLTR